MKSQIKVFALTAAIFAMMVCVSIGGSPASLRQGATSAAVTGFLPGQVLWSY